MNEDVRGRLEILKDIENAEARIDRAMKSTVLTQLKINAYKAQEQAKVVKLGSELKAANLERIKGFASETSSLSSMGSMYDDLIKKDRERILTQIKINGLSGIQEESIKRTAEINKELAQLGREDVVQQAALAEEYSNQQSILSTINGDGAAIVSNLQEQNALASTYAQLTNNQKEYLQNQLDTYTGIKKAIGGVLDTASLLTNNLTAGVGMATIGLGIFANKFSDVNKELGQSFTQGLNKSTISASALGFVFEDTAGTVKALASEFGGLDAATLSTQANVGLIAANMGISNTQAVGLMGSFARLNGGSADMAADMIATTQEFATQNGIIPADLMADLAGSTEAFALFGKDGGKNILEAAGYARKLGVNMDTIMGVTDSLLDFESSITKELELGAMLGKDINLDKARALAFSGESAKAAEETLRAMGGAAAFSKMDVFSKRAAAALAGVTVVELDKMVANQGKAATMGDAVNKKFDAMGETLNMGLNKYLGTSLQGLGGMLIAAGQMNPVLKDMGINMGGMVKNTAKVLKNLLGMIAGPVISGIKSIGGGLAGGVGESKIGKGFGKLKDKLMAGVGDKVKDAATPDVGGGGPNKFMESASKIKMNDVLKGAAAMVIMAGAVFILGKALQEYKDVGLKDVGMVAASIAVLGLAMFGLGMLMSGPIGVGVLFGAAALLVVATSVLILGTALQSIGTGFEMLSTGIATLTPNMLGITSIITTLTSSIPAIGLLSLAFFGLAASLMAVGVAGLAALPGLLAISAVGGVAISVGSMLGIGGDTEGGTESNNTQALIDEMKGLRADLNAGKIGVYMDGVKVAAGVSRVVSKVGSNSYAI